MAELRVKGTGTLKLFESDNTSSVTIASPASLGGDRTITVPDYDVTLGDNTPAWLVYLGSNQTLTNATETKVQFGTEAFDTDGVYDNATDYDVTIPSGKGGKYFIEAASFFDDCDAGQYSSLKLYKNGADYTTPRFFSQVSGAASADNVFPEFSGVIELAAADTISIYAYQNSGGDGNLRAYWCKFSGYKLIG
mgnify:CR=1 FL=1